MTAFHSFWTRPRRVKNNGTAALPDYEILPMMLSALTWRQLHGKITMKTDSVGAEYLKCSNLMGLWDEIDTCLDHVPSDIDPFLFWAAGKLYALNTMDCPCVMLDTDLIIWKDISSRLSYDVVAAHGEPLYEDVYPSVDRFTMSEDYHYPEDWDFSLHAANTAFLYIKNRSFRNYYVQCSVDFMRSLSGGDVTPVTAMCFAEQRILPMCANAYRQSMGYLLDVERVQQQDFATHIWGYKRTLETSRHERMVFCAMCIKRIIQDFPDYELVIASNSQLKDSYSLYREHAKA